jgi:hypothetical protein
MQWRGRQGGREGWMDGWMEKKGVKGRDRERVGKGGGGSLLV